MARPSQLRGTQPGLRVALQASHLALAALLFGGCATSPPPTPGACPGWTAADYAAAPVIRRLRIYTHPATGDSAIEETSMPPRRTNLFNSGKILLQYDFGPGSKTQIVAGPAHFDIALKPSPYRESFLLLAGNVSLVLGDGTRRELLPGDMTVFEDMDAKIGHGGRTGPCGFVSLNIVP